jgi:hypothetical protein
MKTEDLKNLSLEGIVSALQTQNLQKKDFVVSAKYIRMVQSNLQIINDNNLDSLKKILVETGICIENDDLDILSLSVLECCHAQISQKLSIPKRYYDKMLEHQVHYHLLDKNVSHWFMENSSKNYLVRTFIDKEQKTGIARAVLSDRYNTLDNYDVMLATLDAIRETGMNVQIESGDITDTKFYMRFTCPDIEVNAPDLLRDYKVPNERVRKSGDGIISGFVISNSETGNGKFSISPRAIVLACTNGMIFKDDSYAKTHLGSKMEENSTIDWSAETREKNYELVISQVKDAIKTYASKEYLTGKIQELTVKGNKELNNPVQTVKNVTNHLDMSEEKEQSILNYFVKGGDTKAFGVTQALTFYAHTDATPEERFDLESKSVEILNRIESFDTPPAIEVFSN